MNKRNDHLDDHSFRMIYYIIPIPMILGLAFAAYVLITEDSRNQSFCTVAKNEAAYQQSPLQESDFMSHEAISLNLCKDKDTDLDNNDGQIKGRVHWYVCKGTVCGKHWKELLAQPRK